MRKTAATTVIIIIFVIIIGLISWGIIALITESYNLLQGLNIYIEKIYSQFQGYISQIKQGETKIPLEIFNFIETSAGNILNYITNWISNILTSFLHGITSVPVIGIYIIITILSTYFICTDRLYILDQLEHHFPKIWVKKFGVQLRKIIASLGNYLKAESILIFISFIQILIGLYIFKLIGFNVQYPLLAALTIGFVDALPILGAGSVMLPWAIISAVNGNIKLALGLLILYIIILIVHQIIEPKIVGSKIGIHPIFTLIAMYTGFRIIGVLGLFIGPIILIILKNVFETMLDDGFVKSILNRG